MAAGRMNVVITGQIDASTATSIVRALRPDAPPRVRTMRSIVSASVGDQRFVLFLVGVFGGAALLLAALGVYSVISYLVAQRERELTIRVALGARAADILGLVLRQGAILAVAGIVLGSLVALAGTRLLASLLYGVSATDPIAFAGVALVVAAVALAACWLPARRASRIALVALFALGTRAHAQSVTIYRDTYGVPHVFGTTDASTVFGFAYAQAEDNFPRIEANYMLALGRGAAMYGDSTAEEDRLTLALDIPRLAVAEYGRLDAHTRALCDAFAAGLNLYMQGHPGRYLKHIEPWYPLAFIRYNYYVLGFVRDPKIGVPFPVGRGYFDKFTTPSNGSNGWVIGPSKSATGHAMLFINPHLPFFGPGQVYEGHVHSDEGWEFTGYTRFGFPLPYVGHNANLGWVSTDNSADVADGYVETFDDPSRPLAYRYGNGYRTATERFEEIGGHRVRFVTTHHGPIVASYNGKPVAAHMARLADDGWLGEWYAMTKAHTLSEFKAALHPLAMLFGNVMYADRDGNTFYLYNAAVPRRDPKFDWTKPVDGSDPATEWNGYYPMDSLPQLTNPATGWMENCNSSPFLLTSTGNPDPAAFPMPMVKEGMRENPRARASRRILTSTPKFTFDQWKAAAFDTYVISADSLIPLLLAQVHDSGTKLLANWDRRATVSSVAMTVYSIWHHQLGDHDYATALRIAMDSAVPWGDRNRLQRIDDHATSILDLPAFSDAAPSIPVPGVDGYDGAVFTVYTTDVAGQHRRYGVHGGTYVSVVEFGPTTHALSVHTFGASGDPSSTHYVDQAQMYAKGEMKPTWFTLEEVRAHAVTKIVLATTPNPRIVHGS
jgi:penicillin amidase